MVNKRQMAARLGRPSHAARTRLLLPFTVTLLSACAPNGASVGNSNEELGTGCTSPDSGTDAGLTGAPYSAAGIAASGLALSLSAVRPGDSLHGTVTLHNTTSSPFVFGQIVIACRPPGGTNAGGPFADMVPSPTNVTLGAGASLRVDASRTFTASDSTGQWYCYVTFEDSARVWHDGPRVSFSVSGGGASPDGGTSTDGGASTDAGSGPYSDVVPVPSKPPLPPRLFGKMFDVPSTAEHNVGIRICHLNVDWAKIETAENQYQYTAAQFTRIADCLNVGNFVDLVPTFYVTPSYVGDIPNSSYKDQSGRSYGINVTFSQAVRDRIELLMKNMLGRAGADNITIINIGSGTDVEDKISPWSDGSIFAYDTNAQTGSGLPRSIPHARIRAGSQGRPRTTDSRLRPRKSSSSSIGI